MISQSMQDAINAQINAEMWSAYLYLAMSVDSEHDGWDGAAHWFRKQYDEEMQHAFKFVEYLQNQMAQVRLQRIESFPTQWETLISRFEDALIHEKKVTNMINKLYSLAVCENDYTTMTFLQWYLTEQVEEEESAQTIIDKLQYAGNDKASKFMLDKELGSR